MFNKFTFFFGLLLSTLLFCQPPAHADDSQENMAIQAAEAFLTSVSLGHYTESWEQTADLVKIRMTVDEWVRHLSIFQSTFGENIQRDLLKATSLQNLPGYPDGEYIIALFDSTFEKKEFAREIVTLALGEDDRWRIAGYRIR